MPTKRSSRPVMVDGLMLSLLGPAHRLFRDKILGAAGVGIKDRPVWIEPADLAKEALPKDAPLTEASPKEGPSSNAVPENIGNDAPGLGSRTQIHLNDETASAIAKDFFLYHHRQLNETALTNIVIESLARTDRGLDVNDPQTIASLRIDQWKPCQHGPSIDMRGGYTYDWSIQPDMTYMLAINLFDQTQRRALNEPSMNWLLAETHGIGPYLTLELKCEAKSGSLLTAQCQIAVAATLCLYQRKRLRERIGSTTFADLRHYGIIIFSNQYQIWRGTFDGQHYDLTMLDQGFLSRADGVKRYVEWNNAIHRWGLGIHAQSLKRDVETYMRILQEEAAAPKAPVVVREDKA